MKYNLIIVGAGASGLVAAIAAARARKKVLVIEQNPKAGRKILATGNGKCNYTNLVQLEECYRSDDSAFVNKVLSHFDVKNTIKFFEDLGVYPKERDNYIYPNSEQSSSVVDVLMMECKRLGVKFIYETKVIEVKQPYFTVLTEYKPGKRTNKETKDKQKYNTYYAKKLILATGGCAHPKLGSDGSGYDIAKSLGHRIIKPLPALIQLKSPDKICKDLSGVRTVVSVKGVSNGKVIASEEGEIIFTDYGISGIPIMQISRFVSKALDLKENVELTIDFLTEISQEELMILLKNRINHNGEKNIHQILIGLLNDKLAYGLAKKAKMNIDIPSKNISENQLRKLIQHIKEFNLKINGTNSFERAQVTAGGISTKEINPDNMESKIIDNLYLAGELIDVDGTCGGYNLQWAWSSGYVAGKNSVV